MHVMMNKTREDKTTNFVSYECMKKNVKVVRDVGID